MLREESEGLGERHGEKLEGIKETESGESKMGRDRARQRWRQGAGRRTNPHQRKGGEQEKEAVRGERRRDGENYSSDSNAAAEFHEGKPAPCFTKGDFSQRLPRQHLQLVLEAGGGRMGSFPSHHQRLGSWLLFITERILLPAPPPSLLLYCSGSHPHYPLNARLPIIIWLLLFLMTNSCS